MATANEKPGRLRRLYALHAAVILAGVTGCLAVGSLLGGAESPVWKPLLHAHDTAALTFGTDILGDVYITDTRMLRYQPVFDERTVRASAAAINSYADTLSVPVYLLAAPTSAGIYGDLLPESAPLVNEHNLLRTLASELNDKVVWIEAESWLSAEREQEIYYRTDSCWTGYGAFCTYRTAIRKLGFNALGYDHFVITHYSADFYGRLAQQSRYFEMQPDLIDLYHYDAEQPLKQVQALRADGNVPLSDYLLPSRAEESGDPADIFAILSEEVLYMETQNQNSRELLLLTDSFGASMIPFLLQHYHTVTAVNLELAYANRTDWQALVGSGGDVPYTQVLILCGADTLSSNVFAREMRLPAVIENA